LPKLEYDYTVCVLLNHLTEAMKEFFELDFGKLAFEDGVLDPVEVLAAELKGFGDTSFTYIIHQDHIHRSPPRSEGFVRFGAEEVLDELVGFQADKVAIRDGATEGGMPQGLAQALLPELEQGA
jgi:hypothetical protein